MATILPLERSAEWLEPDGLGGYACGTVDLIRTRRYHGVLNVSLRPPIDRVSLVNGFDVWVETPKGQFALVSQRYLPDVVHPDGALRLVDFTTDPWPRWTFRLDDGTEIIHELTVPRGRSLALASWHVSARQMPPPGSLRLLVRPLLSCRDAHSLHQANASFNFDAEEDGELVQWHPYLGIPGVVALSNGAYSHDPVWYHGFLYTAERERGLECTEDLASPGAFRWDLGTGRAALALTTDSADLPLAASASALLQELREEERVRRAAVGPRLLRSAEAFLVRRGSGRTIVAGYPWSTEWGRDTFVSLRGLCVATGRLEDARQILLEWADKVSGGLLPNCFPDRLHQPEFDSVDAPLWYIVAVHEFLQAANRAGRALPSRDCTALREAVSTIVSGFLAGTRFGIRVDDDGLLRAGEPGTALTWMDARLGEWAVTPRVGKPVEVQALWINALMIVSRFSSRWDPILSRAVGSFVDRFWYEAGGYLYDVVDLDHRPGATDPTLRPNQILAIGGLPYPVLGGTYARRVVDTVESRLLTPLGLRTLAPDEEGYVGQCVGSVRQTRADAHLGTAWPWLLGPFVEAWVRVRGDTPAARAAARERFLPPILRHLEEAGLGHVSEIVDGDPPHMPRGSPFQAWSLGEVLRLCMGVLREELDVSAEVPAARPATHGWPVSS
jgi:predicted glycogen debranching enzyme